MNNELELFAPLKSQEISNNPKVTQSGPKKEGESLFDKFLSDAKSDINNTQEETKTNIKEVKKDSKEIDKVDNAPKSENKEVKTDVKKDEVKTTSLMDRLVQETKTNIKEVKKDSKEIDKVDNAPKSENKEVKTDVKLDNTQNDVSVSLSNINTNSKNKDEKISDKKISSSDNKKLENESTIHKNLTSEENTKNSIKNDNDKQKTTLETSDLKSLNNEVKNQKVANELSKLDLNKKDENLTLDKDQLLSQKDDLNKKESLIDKILNENKKDLKVGDDLKKDTEKLNQIIKNNIPSDSSKSKNDLLTNIYISSQHKSSNIKDLEIKHEGVKVAKNATSTKDVEQSSKMLNLGLEKIEVKIEKPSEPQIEAKLSSTFERLSIFKNSSDKSKNSSEDKSKKDTGSFLIQSKKIDDDLRDSKLVNLTVSSAAAQSIQSRIIGARQHMSTMMSDLARVMYENYNPPVTAFRINLNPSSLGTIAIIIRNEQKNSSLSISMKASNKSTKDSLVENQSMLKDSLFKTFAGSSTSFDLEFGSSENNQDTSGNQDTNEERKNIFGDIFSNNKSEETKVTEETNTKHYM